MKLSYKTDKIHNLCRDSSSRANGLLCRHSLSEFASLDVTPWPADVSTVRALPTLQKHKPTDRRLQDFVFHQRWINSNCSINQIKKKAQYDHKTTAVAVPVSKASYFCSSSLVSVSSHPWSQLLISVGSYCWWLSLSLSPFVVTSRRFLSLVIVCWLVFTIRC